MKNLILAIATIALASCTCSGKKDCATCTHCDKATAAKVEICKMCGKAKPNCCCAKH